MVPIIEGAGGVITDWQNRKLDLNSQGQVIAEGDAKTHSAALIALKN